LAALKLATTRNKTVPTTSLLVLIDANLSDTRGWIKMKNPNYWHRDSEREAMQRSRERRQRSHV